MVDSQIRHFRIKTFSQTIEVGSGHKWMSYLHLFEILYCRRLVGKNLKRKTIGRSLPWQYTIKPPMELTLSLAAVRATLKCIKAKILSSFESNPKWLVLLIIKVGTMKRIISTLLQSLIPGTQSCKLPFFSRDLFTPPSVFCFVSLRALAPWRVIDTDLSLRTWRADSLRLRRWKVRGCDSSTFEESVQLSPPLTQDSLQGSKAGASCLL